MMRVEMWSDFWEMELRRSTQVQICRGVGMDPDSRNRIQGQGPATMMDCFAQVSSKRARGRRTKQRPVLGANTVSEGMSGRVWRLAPRRTKVHSVEPAAQHRWTRLALVSS
jgi:hypothetical protein